MVGRLFLFVGIMELSGFLLYHQCSHACGFVKPQQMGRHMKGKFWIIPVLVINLSLTPDDLPFTKLSFAVWTDGPVIKKMHTASRVPVNDREVRDNAVAIENGGAACKVPEELFVPGTVYYLKRNVDVQTGSSSSSSREYFTLWKRHPGEHFQRIVLSSNIITDHKCVSHYYALRDVLKGLPTSDDEGKLHNWSKQSGLIFPL